jgi:hypothetical protein
MIRVLVSTRKTENGLEVATGTSRNGGPIRGEVQIFSCCGKNEIISRGREVLPIMTEHEFRDRFVGLLDNVSVIVW